jgi:PAT family beta-lactamase induction signal transducer AmpG
MAFSKPEKRHPLAWVPSLYYAEGIPYAIVMLVSVLMYKKLGVSNTAITFYTGWLYLPWVIKPLWSPYVDMFKTKRLWIIAMQFFVGCGLAGIALTLPGPGFLKYSLMFFFLMAFSSATHDIAADGFYMLGLSEHDQAFYTGFRSTFYRIALVTAQGFLVILAGHLEAVQISAMKAKNLPITPEALLHANQWVWSVIFWILTALFFVFCIYHKFILPYPPSDKSSLENGATSLGSEFSKTFVTFFQKEKILLIISFLLIYRVGEALLSSLVQPFLLDPVSKGGLGLGMESIGFIYGTIGVIALLCGGIVGGMAASRDGLKKWLWPMFFIINVPALVYIFLAFVQPTNFIIICSVVTIEQFAYGFGFTAYMVYMIYVCAGEHKTSHYSIATGFMALSMMLPRLFAGWLQTQLGYKAYFLAVFSTIIIGFLIVRKLPLDPEFGKKTN